MRLSARLIAGSAAALTVFTLGSASVQAVASASLPNTAVTYLGNHPDSGGGGNTWAVDTLNVFTTITRDGSAPSVNCNGHAPCVRYNVSEQTNPAATFRTVAGELMPNQGPGWTGQVINHSVSGTFYGSESFTSFYSASPVNFAALTNTHAITSISQLACKAFNPATSTCGSVTHFWFKYTTQAGKGSPASNVNDHWLDSDSDNDGQNVGGPNDSGQIRGL